MRPEIVEEGITYHALVIKIYELVACSRNAVSSFLLSEKQKVKAKGIKRNYKWKGRKNKALKRTNQAIRKNKKST